MAKFLSFRDGGKTDEEGIAKPFADIFTGEVKAGFTTTQLGSPAMGVAVAEGSAFIDTGNGYPYHVYTDADENVTIATADGSNPRWDVIVAYVDLTEVDSTDPNNPDAFKMVAVAGTPAGSPAEPNGAAIQAAIGASNPYILIARVVVGAGVTTITNANITDRRTMVTTNVNAGTNKVVTASVADSAITTAKINDAAVTPDKRSGGFAHGVVDVSGTGAKTVTGLSFQPKFIMFMSTIDTSDVTAAFAMFSWNGTNVYGMTGASRSGAGESSASRGRVAQSTVTTIVMNSSGAATTHVAFTPGAFTSDGFTYNVGTAATANVAFIAFG